MSLTEGGLLVVGVSDARVIQGAPLDQAAYDRIARAAQACSVDVTAVGITVDGVALSVVAVPEVRGRIVTTPDGRLLRRVGSDSLPLVGDALGRFVREREERAADAEPIFAFELEQIDMDSSTKPCKRRGARKPRAAI